MALDDFSSDKNSSSSSDSKTGPPKKIHDNSQEDSLTKEEADLVIEDPEDPAYEVDGIEHLGNVLVTFDTDEFESGANVTEGVKEDFVSDTDRGELEIIDITDGKGDNGDLEQRNPSEGTTVTKKGSNTVVIGQDEFEQALAETGLDFHEEDYPWAAECIYETESEQGLFAIRVYSTIEQANSKSRSTGEDSIKLQVIHNNTGRPVISTTRTYRTPGWSDRLKEKIKDLKSRKDEMMFCDSCGSVMVIRENSSSGDKFYGCTSYPDCRNTESYNG